jgi:UDP-glucose 4-epimerase
MTVWQGRSALVTGAAGFLGQHLVVRLLELGARVYALDLKPPEPCLSELRKSLHDNPRLTWVHASFLDQAALAAAVQECAILFHMACTLLPASSNEDIERDLRENLIGSIGLFQSFAESGANAPDSGRRIVIPSSGGTIYGVPRSLPVAENHGTNPLCSYGAVKLALEKYLGIFESLYGVSYAALRISNPFGPGQQPKPGHGVIPNFIYSALHDEPIEIWGDGSIVRDYLYVDDVINALILAAEQPSSFVLNIGSGSGLSLNEIYRAIEMAIGRPLQVTYKDRRTVDVPVNVLDSTQAAILLGWKPQLPFDRGLSKTIDWIKSIGAR